MRRERGIIGEKQWTADCIGSKVTAMRVISGDGDSGESGERNEKE